LGIAGDEIDAHAGVPGQPREPAPPGLFCDERAFAASDEDAFRHESSYLSAAQRLNDEHARTLSDGVAQTPAVENHLSFDENVDVLPQPATLVTDVECEPGRDLLHRLHHFGDRRRFDVELLPLELGEELKKMLGELHPDHGSGSYGAAHRVRPASLAI